MARQTVETFPARLAELRQLKGLTQESLAREAGTSFSAISKLEQGQRAPSLELAVRLAAALGCGVEDLLVPAGSDVRSSTPGRPKRNPKKFVD